MTLYPSNPPVGLRAPKTSRGGYGRRRIQSTSSRASRKAVSSEGWLLQRQLREAQTENMGLKRRVDDLKGHEETARLDPLTRLFNRRGGEELLDRLIERNEKFGIVLFDLDHFKKVNDTLGHDVGDEVLRMVADILRQELREKDVKVRQGGDEHLVILKEPISAGEVGKVAERLREIIQNELGGDELLKKKGLHVTASLGTLYFDPEALGGKDILAAAVTAASDNAETKPVELIRQRLLKLADLACYEAKHGGRNKVCAGSITTEDLAVDMLKACSNRLSKQKPVAQHGL